MSFVRFLSGLAALFLSASPAFAIDASWHVYYDSARHFSIAYPDGWTVNPQYADKGYRFGQGDADDVRYGLAISPTAELQPGTNLDSKSLVLAVEPARPGDTCQANAFLADPPPDYTTQTIQDTPVMAHTLAEPGDVYAIEHIVQMVSRTPCLAVQVTLVYRQTPLHAPHPEPQFDRRQLFALLDEIVASLKPAR